MRLVARLWVFAMWRRIDRQDRRIQGFTFQNVSIGHGLRVVLLVLYPPDRDMTSALGPVGVEGSQQINRQYIRP